METLLSTPILINTWTCHSIMLQFTSIHTHSTFNLSVQRVYDDADFFQFHQFVTQTAATIDWAVESEIHLLSLSCHYLMDGVLLTAALHLAYLNPEQRDSYNYLSTQHQDLALGPFRSAMSQITAEKCHKVFAFSILLLVSQYASSRCTDFSLPSPGVTTRLPSWIICLRGCVYIVKEASDHIRSGPLGSLLAQERGGSF
jgi:hypothetical protein